MPELPCGQGTIDLSYLHSTVVVYMLDLHHRSLKHGWEQERRGDPNTGLLLSEVKAMVQKDFLGGKQMQACFAQLWKHKYEREGGGGTKCGSVAHMDCSCMANSKNMGGRGELDGDLSTLTNSKNGGGRGELDGDLLTLSEFKAMIIEAWVGVGGGGDPNTNLLLIAVGGGLDADISTLRNESGILALCCRLLMHGYMGENGIDGTG
ncbi:hypothetical protein BKA83DRAFT_4123365 [Pisolithus microcarpus]|nr:hypothetical protein BKA83DRAFT_4123365 [Pisolithus microcarpus]